MPTPDHDELEIATTLARRLYPLPRSLTGDGVRQTHDLLEELVPLERQEIPSGTPVLDWQVPQEWRVSDAHLIGPDGIRRFDVHDNALRLVNYSIPFRGALDRTALDAHLYSLPDRPTAIPYVTSYYKPRWGFCVTETERQALPDGMYEVVVDTELFDGSMSIAEAILPGTSATEVLFTTYTCHPRLANDELTGLVALPLLYRRLAERTERRLTFRFLFAPETIGALAYLDKRGDELSNRLAAGCVVTNLGRAQPYRFKLSQRGNTLVDRAFRQVLRPHPHEIIEFEPVGSDERQFCSPGFDLPYGNFARCETYFPEYHCSDDNLENLSVMSIIEAVDRLEEVCLLLDANRTLLNLKPYGEPQLGKRGAYPDLGGTSEPENALKATLWVLNQCDGQRDLLSIAERSGLPFSLIAERAEVLSRAGLLEANDDTTYP